MSGSPVAVLALEAGERKVEFTYGRLVKIEQATGETVHEIVFGSVAAIADAESLSPAQLGMEVLRRTKFTTLRSLVAACLDVTVDQVEALVPPSRWAPCVGEVLGKLGEAVLAINGVESRAEGKAPAVAEASPPSEPGPASSSG